MIAGLKSYPATKDSGVPWLGMVPEHWEVVPLSRALTQRKEKNDPIKTTDILSLSLDTGVIPYAEKKAGGNKAKEDLSAYMLAYPGDIVVNSMNVVVGSVGLSKYFGAVSPVYYMLRAREEDDLVEYFEAIFQDVGFQRSLFGLGNGIMFIESRSSGKLNTIRLRIPMTRLKKVVLPYPAPGEQVAIVRFLDHVDRRIRRYIRVKEKLITLLEEQKQAIIHRAVTRGLGPNVRLKPSGVEWLGDVPEHWEILQLGRLIKLLTGFPFKSEGFTKDADDIRLLRGVNIAPGKVRWNDIVRWRISDRLSYLSFELHAGDIVLGMDRPIIQSGVRVATIEESDLPSLLLQRVARIRPQGMLRADFLILLLAGKSFSAYLTPIFTGISVPHLSPEQIRLFRFALPGLMEQEKIVEWAVANMKTVESAVACTRREISLLREYRTRLIADVVTGKLDVRDTAALLPDEDEKPEPLDEGEALINGEEELAEVED